MSDLVRDLNLRHPEYEAAIRSTSMFAYHQLTILRVCLRNGEKKVSSFRSELVPLFIFLVISSSAFVSGKDPVPNERHSLKGKFSVSLRTI
jgi:hypothetical protein